MNPLILSNCHKSRRTFQFHLDASQFVFYFIYARRDLRRAPGPSRDGNAVGPQYATNGNKKKGVHENMISKNERTTPSAAAEGKANGDRSQARETARKTAEIRQRQRSMMNAMLCCMI